MARIDRSHLLTLLSCIALIAIWPTSANARLSPQVANNADITGPALPVLPPMFRIEVVALGIPNAEKSSTEQLEKFAALIQKTKNLSNLARAPYLDWVAKVQLFRGNGLQGLPYARSAYFYRLRTLGASHPLCKQSLELIESLQLPSIAPLDRRASNPKEAKFVSNPEPPLFPPARLAILTGAPRKVRASLIDLEYNADQYLPLSQGTPS
ncbi:MAG: hypothetical protein ACI87A_001193 [Planctomycetota bacterium]|jgi:hypothetical protein